MRGLLAVPAAALAVPASAHHKHSTIAETAIAVSSLDGFDRNNDDFDMLLQAPIAADLVAAVADLTVFAPTDQAFVRLARDLGYSDRGYDEAGAFAYIVAALTDLGGGDPIPVLTDVLLYQLSPSSTFNCEIKAAGSLRVPTMLGESFEARGGRWRGPVRTRHHIYCDRRYENAAIPSPAKASGSKRPPRP